MLIIYFNLIFFYYIEITFVAFTNHGEWNTRIKN